jgi:PmbA protein
MSVPEKDGHATFDPERLLKRATSLGAAQTEVFALDSCSSPVSFENSKLKSAVTTEAGGVAVRLVKDGRFGFATSTRPGDDAVVDMAARASEFGPVAGCDFAPKAQPDPTLAVYDPAVVGWSQERMLEAGEELVQTLKDLENGIMATVLMDRDVQRVRVVTSTGQDVSYEATWAACTGLVEMTEADNMIMVYDFLGARRLPESFRSIGERVTWLYRQARRNVPMRAGVYPVIFAPTAATALISPLAALLDGKAVLKGESPWKDKIGEQVFAENFTLYDDPTVPWGLRTTPIDDEGIPARRRAVIERGVLKGFLLDLRTARALGLASTGNGYRTTLQTMPSPRASNLVLEAGDRSLAEMMASVKEGLYVVDLMGAWAGNPYTGQVSGNIQTGFRIENGEITGRVKDCLVSVGIFESLRNGISALGRETAATMAGQVLPHILLGNVSVSAKE